MFKWIDLQIYFRHAPAGDEMHLPYRMDKLTVEEEFERGGVAAVERFFDLVLAPVFDQLKQELMKPYVEAEKAGKRPIAQFGPLGAFLEVGRPDIIHKVALEEHEQQKKESKRERTEGGEHHQGPDSGGEQAP